MLFRIFGFTALGGPCSLQLYAADESALERAGATARDEVLRIEAKYSRYRDDSVLSSINAAAGDPHGSLVDEETAALLDYAATAYEQSDGLFDATSGVLRRAWDFRAARLPAAGEIEQLLPLVGWDKLRWQRPRLVLPKAGMQLDFGGFGKEYAADRAALVLRAQGIRHGLVELGGDVCVVGPQPGGTPWRIGIRHPRELERVVASIDLSDGAVASSGDYERYFERDGRRYSHVLDPRSGWPVQGLASVSVLAPQCLIAGTATTIAMLKGEAGEAWLAGLGLRWLAVDGQGRLAGDIAVPAVAAAEALMP